jgi:hypothetical protein
MKSEGFDHKWLNPANRDLSFGYAGARKGEAVSIAEMEKFHSPPAPRETQIDWYVGCVGMKERLFVRFAPHQYVNVHAAVHYRIPVGGRIWTSADDLMIAALASAPNREELPAAFRRRLKAATPHPHREFA